MAIVTCKDCKSEISTDAKVCPKCGATISAPPNIIGALIGLSVTAFMLWFFFAGGIESKVSTDAEKQYEIAKKSGGPMDACVQAGFVSAAYFVFFNIP